MLPLALVTGGVFGVFGAAAGCSSSDSDGNGSGGPVDSGNPPDTGGGGNSDASSACAPASVQDFEPKWERPPAWYRGACTTADLAAFNTACESSASAKYFSSECADFRKSADHEKCSACIFDSTTQQAALTETSLGHRLPNISACIANASNDFSSAGCAAKYQALVQCEIAACTTNCPLSAAGDVDFFDCTKRAANGPCKPYEDKWTTCQDGGAVQSCDGKPELGTVQVRIVQVLCGKRPNDGG